MKFWKEDPKLLSTQSAHIQKKKYNLYAEHFLPACKDRIPLTSCCSSEKGPFSAHPSEAQLSGSWARPGSEATKRAKNSDDHFICSVSEKRLRRNDALALGRVWGRLDAKKQSHSTCFPLSIVSSFAAFWHSRENNFLRVKTHQIFPSPKREKSASPVLRYQLGPAPGEKPF